MSYSIWLVQSSGSRKKMCMSGNLAQVCPAACASTRVMGMKNVPIGRPEISLLWMKINYVFYFDMMKGTFRLNKI